MRKTIREIFSGVNGKLSAKRVIGGIAMAVALGCTIYLVIRDGSNTVVENLLMTIFITSVSLLGLPAITSVWGNSKISVGKTEEDNSTPVAEPPQPTPVAEPPQPTPVEHPDCKKCIYKRRGTE